MSGWHDCARREHLGEARLEEVAAAVARRGHPVCREPGSDVNRDLFPRDEFARR